MVTFQHEGVRMKASTVACSPQFGVENIDYKLCSKEAAQMAYLSQCPGSFKRTPLFKFFGA